MLVSRQGNASLDTENLILGRREWESIVEMGEGPATETDSHRDCLWAQPASVQGSLGVQEDPVRPGCPLCALGGTVLFSRTHGGWLCPQLQRRPLEGPVPEVAGGTRGPHGPPEDAVPPECCHWAGFVGLSHPPHIQVGNTLGSVMPCGQSPGGPQCLFPPIKSSKVLA